MLSVAEVRKHTKHSNKHKKKKPYKSTNYDNIAPDRKASLTNNIIPIMI